jgi:hypothetical protein
MAGAPSLAGASSRNSTPLWQNELRRPIIVPRTFGKVPSLGNRRTKPGGGAMRKPSTFELSFFPLLATLALTSLGCTKTDSPGVAGQDGGVVDGNAQEAVFIVLPDASTFTFTFAELPDSGLITQDDGTCPLLFPNLLAHYPSEVDSPCPKVEPDMASSCPDSLAGVTCVYPSSLSPGAQDILTCYKGLYASSWSGYQRTCKRTGRDCLVDADHPDGLPGVPIQLTSSCASRSLVSCPVVTNDTAQTALDNVMRTIASNCLESTGATTGGALSVFFDGDCPTSFVVDPAELTDCIKAQLESERLDCASGLVCGASDYVSLGCGDCR